MISNSKDINIRIDINSRHKKQKIDTFNTREVLFYDGNNAYKLTISLANLTDGKKVAYAKKMLKADNNLLNKIKQEGMSSTSNKGRSSQFPQVNSTIPLSNENVNTINKYSMQNNINNTQWQEYLDKNFKPTGIRTNMEDIRLPQKSKDNLPNVNTVTEDNKNKF